MILIIINVSFSYSIDTLWSKWTQSGIISIEFSPDDSMILASNKLNARLFRTLDGELLYQYDGISNSRYSLNGQYIIGHNVGKIIILNPSNLELIREFDSFDSYILDFDFSEDMTKIFAVIGNKTNQDNSTYKEQDYYGVFVFDTQTGRIIDTLKFEPQKVEPYKNWISNIKHLKGNKLLIIENSGYETPKPNDKWIHNISYNCYDLNSKEKVYSTTFTNDMYNFFISKNREYFYTLRNRFEFQDKGLRIWDANQGKIIKVLLNVIPTDIEDSKDGKFIAVAEMQHGKVSIWDRSKDYELRGFLGLGTSSTASLSSTNNLICSGLNGLIYLAKVEKITNILNETNSNEVIYPNPVNENISLNFNVSIPSHFQLEITNTIGQLLFQQTLGHKDIGLQSYNLNVQFLPNGSYNLRIFSPTQVINFNIIKFE